MVTQWALGPLHLKSKIRVSLLQEVLFVLDIHSVGVNEYGDDDTSTRKSVRL